MLIFLINSKLKDLLGQLWVLQEVELEEEPEQYDPPPDGAGLLQERDRLFVPLAQLLVQLPQLPHPPQLPFTALADK